MTHASFFAISEVKLALEPRRGTSCRCRINSMNVAVFCLMRFKLGCSRANHAGDYFEKNRSTSRSDRRVRTVFYNVSNALRAGDWLMTDAIGLYDQPYSEGLVWPRTMRLRGAAGTGYFRIRFPGAGQSPSATTDHFQAERGRLLLRLVLADSPAEVSAIMKEGNRRFGRRWGCTLAGIERQKLDLTMRVLRLASRSPRKTQRHASGGKPNVTKNPGSGGGQKKAKATPAPNVSEDVAPQVRTIQSSDV